MFNKLSKLKPSSFALKRVCCLPQATPDVLQVKAKSKKKATVLTDTTEKNATDEEKEKKCLQKKKKSTKSESDQRNENSVGEAIITRKGKTNYTNESPEDETFCFLSIKAYLKLRPEK